MASNDLGNGLVLLQTNPDCAADLQEESRFYGWLFTKGANGNWVSYRTLTPFEIEIAKKQWAEGIVLHGTPVRYA